MDKYTCEKSCKEGLTDHEFVAEHGNYNEIYEIKCLNCQNHQKVNRHLWLSTQLKNDIRPSKAYLTVYPRIEPHSGEYVLSKEHEKETIRRKGFHEAPHGVNERYNGQEKDWSR